MFFSRQSGHPPPEDDPLAVFHATPKAAHPFPRRKAALYALICLLWLGFGIAGRDAWKPDETLLAAAIAERLNGEGLVVEEFAGRGEAYLRLASVTAAASAGWLPVLQGARLANVLLLAAGFALLWGAVARWRGARAAWLALLLLVGCFGFMVRAHALNLGVPAFFGMALALFGAATLADERRLFRHALLAGAAIGLGAAFLLLSVGAVAAGAGALALLATRRAQSAVFAVAAAFFAPFLLWAWQMDLALAPPPAAGGALLVAGDFLRVAAWSLLPLLPIAAAGWWQTRRAPLDRFNRVCLAAAAAGCVVFLLEGRNEEDFYILLPPLAALAAAALLKLPDESASVMDFFALLIIGLCVVGGLWLAWLALSFPSAPLLRAAAEALTMHFPGHALPPTAMWRVAAAAALTLGWLALLCNFGRSNERAVVNFGCGMTVVWAVFNLLLAGYVDSGKSYRPAALAVRAAADGACVAAPADRHWRAQLAYYGVALGGAECPYVLLPQESPRAQLFVRRGEEGYYFAPKV